MLSRLLDGFEGKFTTSKWAQLAKCSQDTATRDTHITKFGIELLAGLEKPTGDFVTRLFAGATVRDLKTVLKVNDQIRTKLS